ncbi:MAG: hypothetical protein NC251_11100 [Lachnoclostridium sp.]|nr:hypothetical protein [Lachnospira sp.]MCM1248967.1 hypothetical protein [Lachnoclostridium sp.]MCM1535179.1 hypothetical protein [Clostridium sp.]
MGKTVENMADIREDEGMGIGIGANYSGRTVYTIKNADGTTAATFSVTKRTSKSKQKQKQKKKKLQYNFKQLSNQILASKTSRGARRVAAKARGMIASLVSKLKMGEYDDQEIANAIIHARKMERIARKKMRHMQEEEMAKTGGSCLEELEERESEDELDGMEEVAIITENGQEQTISREEWQALMKEVEELMASLMEESMEEFSEAMELSDLPEEVMGAAPREMDPEDLKSLKRKHRAKELQEITEADMKYLQALFQKLEQEKREVSNGSSSHGSSSFDGVSLELGGVEMPVQTEVPVMIEGANMDTSV